MKSAFEILYSPEAEDHLEDFQKVDQRRILNRVHEQLKFEPDAVTKNRKPMRPNPLAPWELRFGKFRVYYDIEYDPDRKVHIRAIGIKIGNEIRIGKEVIKL